jgi:hypothetical protein
MGILESITQKEKALIDREGNRREIIVEPLTNYIATRVQKDMNNSNTLLGGMFTATNRDLVEDYSKDEMHRASYSGGLDFTQYWKNKTYYLRLKTAFSRIIGNQEVLYKTQTSSPHFFQRPDAKHLQVDSLRTHLDGFGATVQIGKAGNSKWMYTFWITMRSPGFNLNEIGYMNRNDEIQQIAWIGFRQREPFSIFRSLNLDMNQWYATTFGFEKRYFGGNIYGFTEFVNYWGFGFGCDRDSKSISTETLRGGPALKYDGAAYIYLHLHTDWRKKVQFSYNSNHFFRDRSTGNSHDYNFGVRVQVSDALSTSIYPAYSKRYDRLEYVQTLDELDETKYIRGTINQVTTYLTLRFSYNITPEFTIEFYGMPFISAGKYADFKYITDAGADRYEDRFIQYTEEQIKYSPNDEIYEVDEDLNGITDYSFDQPNFNVFDFNANLVVRWEYRPGSTLFIVWSQKRNKYLSGGNFKLGDDIKTLFADTYPHDIFMVKLSYRLDMNRSKK